MNTKLLVYEKRRYFKHVLNIHILINCSQIRTLNLWQSNEEKEREIGGKKEREKRKIEMSHYLEIYTFDSFFQALANNFRIYIEI